MRKRKLNRNFALLKMKSYKCVWNCWSVLHKIMPIHWFFKTFKNIWKLYWDVVPDWTTIASLSDISDPFRRSVVYICLFAETGPANTYRCNVILHAVWKKRMWVTVESFRERGRVVFLLKARGKGIKGEYQSERQVNLGKSR